MTRLGSNVNYLLLHCCTGIFSFFIFIGSTHIQSDEDRQKQAELDRIDHELAKIKLSRLDVPRDGNCQFHALSYLLEVLLGVRITHEELRTRLVNSMIQLADTPVPTGGFFRDILAEGETYPQYIERMLTITEWGDGNTLAAFVREYLGVGLVVHNTDFTLAPMVYHAADADIHTTFHLLWDRNCSHYQVLLALPPSQSAVFKRLGGN